MLLIVKGSKNHGLILARAWCFMEIAYGAVVQYKKWTYSRYFQYIFVIDSITCLVVLIVYLVMGIELSYANSVPLFTIQIVDYTVLSIFDENKRLAIEAGIEANHQVVPVAVVPVAVVPPHPDNDRYQSPPYNYDTYVLHTQEVMV